MRIISADTKHLKKIIELHQLLYVDELKSIQPFPWSLGSWVETNLQNIYIAEDNDILGAVCVRCSILGFVIETLMVDFRYQGLGIGRSLVEHAKMLVYRAGGKRLGVCSFTVYGKKRFYENCGFTYVREAHYEDQTGKKHPYHCLIMEL
jgi:GNAT superfamily N-acetyltransferase